MTRSTQVFIVAVFLAVIATVLLAIGRHGWDLAATLVAFVALLVASDILRAAEWRQRSIDVEDRPRQTVEDRFREASQ